MKSPTRIPEHRVSLANRLAGHSPVQTPSFIYKCIGLAMPAIALVLLLWASLSARGQTNCPSLSLLCSDNSIRCGAPLPPPPAIDDPCCTNVVLSLLSSTATPPGCTQIVSRVWQAVDFCYNVTNTCTQTVTILPSVPVLFCQDTNIPCGAPLPTNPPAWFDACCSNVTVSLVSTRTNPIPPGACAFSVSQFWLAVDHCCGTSNGCMRTVSAMPSPPTLLCKDLTLPCKDFSYTNPPALIDMCCTNVVVSLISSIMGSTTLCSMTFTQTWSAFDHCCGLSTMCTRSVTVTVPFTPLMSCPDVTITCGTPFPPPPPVFDPCSPVTLTLLSGVTNFGPGHCGLMITQSWAAVEFCGGSNFCKRTITIMPSPPTLLCSDLVLTCGDYSYTSPPPRIDVCCTNVVVKLLDPTNAPPPCSGTFTQTWEAFDVCCGLVTTCARAVTISYAPSLVCTGLDLICGDFSYTNPPAYTDLCCTDVTVMLLKADVSGPIGCSGTITQTWAAFEHCCGTMSMCTRVVTITVPPPRLLCSNLVVQCGDPGMGRPPAYIPSSCCTNVEVTLLDVTTVGSTSPCSGTVTQTWRAMDLCCGGTNICTRTVTVMDTTPPSITCPSNMVVSTCGTNAIVSWPVIATDNCSLAGVSSSPPSGTSFLPNTTNTVTCSAWDLCHNTNTCTFTIAVVRPTLGSLTMTCSAGIVTITWADGILQQSDSVVGPWTDVPSTAPPTYSTPASAASACYRLRCNAP